MVGFDFAVRQRFVRLLGEPHPARDVDPVAEFLSTISDQGQTPLGAMLAAAWRAALLAVADGIPDARARAGLAAIRLDEAVYRPPIS
jgi:hypothetical protein